MGNAGSARANRQATLSLAGAQCGDATHFAEKQTIEVDPERSRAFSGADSPARGVSGARGGNHRRGAFHSYDAESLIPFMFVNARGPGLILLLAALMPLEAAATLGVPASSVAEDQVHMKAMRAEKAGSAYTVYEITTPSGTVVREFVSSATGQVFAVAWQGPFMPDLKQVLGNHFGTLVDATGKERIGRSNASVDRPEVVIRSGGHMRAFTGKAYLPGLMPQGVRGEDIR